MKALSLAKGAACQSASKSLQAAVLASRALKRGVKLGNTVSNGAPLLGACKAGGVFGVVGLHAIRRSFARNNVPFKTDEEK